MIQSGIGVSGRTDSPPVVVLVLMLALTMFDGVIDSCIGPSLHDLQCIYSVSVQTISVLFPVYTGFKAAGCLLYSPVLVVLGDTTLVPLCVIISSCMVAVIPLCPLFPLVVVVCSVLGLTEGIVNTGRVSRIGSYAQDTAVPFHLLGVTMGIGNILGPLILSPFLTSSRHGNSPNTTGDANQTQFECPESHSEIYYAYLLTAAVGIMLTSGLIFIYSREYGHSQNVKTDRSRTKCNLGKYEIGLVLGLTLLMMTGGATSFVYGTLLSLFGTHCSLRIRGTIMALMTSSFYLVTMFGRMCGVFLSLIMSQLNLLITCFTGVLASSLVLLFTADMSIVYLWSGSHILGLFFAPVYSSVVAWAFEHLPCDNKISSVVVFSDLAGTSLLSLIVGELMASHGSHMLHVCMVTIALLQILIFAILIWFVSQAKNFASGEGYAAVSTT